MEGRNCNNINVIVCACIIIHYQKEQNDTRCQSYSYYYQSWLILFVPELHGLYTSEDMMTSSPKPSFTQCHVQSRLEIWPSTSYCPVVLHSYMYTSCTMIILSKANSHDQVMHECWCICIPYSDLSMHIPLLSIQYLITGQFVVAWPCQIKVYTTLDVATMIIN